MPYITIETYPDLMLGNIENPNYDITLRLFTVPYFYLVNWCIANALEVEEFLGEYTWDDTLELYYDAYSDHKLLDERIIGR